MWPSPDNRCIDTSSAHKLLTTAAFRQISQAVGDIRLRLRLQDTVGFRANHIPNSLSEPGQVAKTRLPRRGRFGRGLRRKHVRRRQFRASSVTSLATPALKLVYKVKTVVPRGPKLSSPHTFFSDGGRVSLKAQARGERTIDRSPKRFGTGAQSMERPGQSIETDGAKQSHAKKE